MKRISITKYLPAVTLGKARPSSPPYLSDQVVILTRKSGVNIRSARELEEQSLSSDFSQNVMILGKNSHWSVLMGRAGLVQLV